MMGTKRTNRIISWLLSLAMVLTILPMSVFAVGEYTLSEDGTLTITSDISIYTTMPWQNEKERIKTVVFQADITALPESAFSYCQALESITIPESVTSIGNNVFDHCTALESITIPESVTSIGNSAFLRCDVLTDIYYEGTSAQWGEISIGVNAIPNGVTVHTDDDTPELPPEAVWGPSSTDLGGTGREGTLAEAIAAAQNNSDVKYILMKKEVTVQGLVIGGGDFTLDMGGNILECERQISITDGKIVFKNGTFENNWNYAIWVDGDKDNTEITFESGTYSAVGSVVYAKEAKQLTVMEDVTMDADIPVYIGSGCVASLIEGADLSGYTFDITYRGGANVVTSGIYDYDVALDTWTLDLSNHPDPAGTTIDNGWWDTIYVECITLPDGYGLFDELDAQHIVTSTSYQGKLTVKPLHQHAYTYTANENVITEACSCGHSETATVIAPTDNLTFDNTPKEATVEYSSANWQGGELTIAYSDGGNTNAGSVTASIEKDGVTASVTFTIAKVQIEKPTADTTEFVYNGSEQTYAVAENDKYEVSGNKMTNAGSQEVTVAIKDKTNYEWSDGTTDDVKFTFTIAKVQIEKPTADTTEFVYNGSEQTYAVAQNDKYEVSGNKMTNAGSQEVTVAIKDKTNYEWSDGTTDDVKFTFTIAKATPTPVDGSVTKASSIRKNNKLSASAIIGGKYKGVDGAVLDGTYAWREPDKGMVADSKEIVIFTPNDTNYAPVEIEVDVDVDTTTSPSGGGSSISVPHYTVKFETNGGSNIADVNVARNSKLAEPQAPTKDGYSFIGWYIDEELTTAYDFDTLVTEDVTLYAKWEKHDDEEPVTTEWKNPFNDVDEDDWFYNDVKFVSENTLMNGIDETSFAPNGIITRAMMVTVLYRAEGEPEMRDAQWFEDVAKGQWYSDAVAWATFNGITVGYGDGNFGPDDYITREQIAAIMHRYAQYKGYDVSVGENTNILSYDDFADISEYAIAPMQWACGSGLMKGKTESTLNPKAFATRAEIAAILHRFIEANR